MADPDAASERELGMHSVSAIAAVGISVHLTDQVGQPRMPLVLAAGPGFAGTGYSSANTYAVTTRASRSGVISSSYLEGTTVRKPFVVQTRVPTEYASSL